jgi:hypothetical protein
VLGQFGGDNVNKTLLLGAIALACTPLAAHADSLEGRLKKMPPPEFVSTKPLGDLEFCIGVGLGKWLIPKTLHGDGRTLLYTGRETEIGNMLIHSVLITDDGEKRSIAYYTSKGWNDRLKRLIASCA